MMNILEKRFMAFHDGKLVYGASRVGDVLYWNNGTHIDPHAFKQDQPAVLLQYIGYNDAIGGEIYEGDVLRDEFDRVLLVEWWNGGFTLRALTNTNFKRTSLISQWFDGYTPLPNIIGNAFKNPELLGGDA